MPDFLKKTYLKAKSKSQPKPTTTKSSSSKSRSRKPSSNSSRKNKFIPSTATSTGAGERVLIEKDVQKRPISTNTPHVQPKNGSVIPELSSKPGETVLIKKNVEKPQIITSKQIKDSTVSNFTRLQGSYGKIDTNARYIYKDKEISGTDLQKIVNREKQKNIGNLVQTLGTPTGKYVKQGDRYYSISPEIDYVMKYGDKGSKENIMSSIGTSRFEKTYSKSYETLTETEKEDYGYRFAPFIDKPIKEWKYHPGGTRYLQENKEGIIDQYMKGKTAKDFFNQDDSYLALYKYQTKGGIWGKDIDDPKFLRSLAWDEISKTDAERKTQYFSELPSLARGYSSTHNAFMSGVTFPVTLAQTGVKYIKGSGEYKDVFGRIGTGKTVFPDVGKILHDNAPGGPSGAISTVVGTGISSFTGNKDDSIERFMKHPISGVSATVGEIGGMLFGGYGLSKTKQFVKGGMYRVGTPIKQSFVARGLMKPLPISRYSPTNLVRTGYWKSKELFGKAKYIPEENVWSGEVLSGSTKFAKARNVTDMVQKFYETQGKLGGSTDDLLGIHTAPHRFSYMSRIKPGGSETTGLSVSSFGEGSPHFLRSGGYSSGSLSTPIKGISIIPKIKLPTGIITRFKTVFRLPKNLRNPYHGETTNSFYGRVSKHLQQQKSGSYTTLAAKAEIGGPEIESIIRYGKLGQGQWMKRISSKYYTTYKGHTIPLPEYNLLGSGAPSKTVMVLGGNTTKSSVTSSIKKFFSPYSYSAHQTLPLFRKGFFISSIGKQASSPIIKSSSIKSLSSISSKHSPSSGFSIPSINRYSFSSYKKSKSISYQPLSKSRISQTSSPSKSIGSKVSSSIPSISLKSIPSAPSIPRSHYSSGYSSGVKSPLNNYPYGLDYSSKTSKRKKKNDTFDFIKGYRTRTWKVPEMKDLLGGF